MRRIVPGCLVILALGTGAKAQSADTIVLERNGYCFGQCPTYRLAITSDGNVEFAGTKEVRQAQVSRRLSPEAFGDILSRLQSAGFFDLDSSYAPGSASCRQAVTDMPGGSISISRAASHKRVRFYRGCLDVATPSRDGMARAISKPAGPIAVLMGLASYIDSVAGTDEWVFTSISPRTKPIHHYVWFGGDREEIRTDSLFLNTPQIEGAQILYPWRAVETAKDRYDLTAILDDIEFLKAHGKKLWIQLQDVTFNEKRVFVPKYLLEDSTYHGGAEKTYSIGRKDDSLAVISGWVARRWDPAVQERMHKLYNALAAELDGKIEGINLPETALEYGSSGKLFPPGFDHQSYRNAVAVNLRALKLAFKKSVAMQYANFMPGEWRPTEDKLYLVRLYGTARSIGAGVGGPDLMPYREGQVKSSYPLIKGSANRIPTGIAVQDGNLAEVNPQTKKKVTAGELLDYANRELRVDYIFWGREEPYYSTEVIPLLRKTKSVRQQEPAASP